MTKLSEERPEFFKVFIPKFSSEQMLIPPAFVRRYISTTPKNTEVRDSSGKCWNIAMARTEKKLYFGAGWEEFCKGRSVEFGDFLLFRYSTSDSSFDVEIFGKNGCKKNFSASSKIKEETVDEEIRRICWTEKSGASEKSQVKTRNNRNLRRVSGKNFQFSAVLTSGRSFRYGVVIPRSVIKEIKLKPDIVLQYQGNKLWPVNITHRSDGRGCISNGWSNFRKENNLKANDTCIFEPILGKGKACEEIKVKVIRGDTRRAQIH